MQARMLGCAAAAFLATAAAVHAPIRPVRGPAVSRAAAPAMVFDQLKKMVDDSAKGVKEAAAAAVVEKKVAEKLAKAQEKYNIPEKYTNLMTSFFTSYMTEIYINDRDMDKYESILTVLMKKVLETAKEPHVFEPFHEAIREPFDYYKMGCDFAEGMVDLESSVIEGAEQIEKMRKQIAAGDNVVLFANHQSEADPQIYSVLLDPKVPGFAESTIFVAGDRVTTDLLAMPFSMGRNLLCIFSKKHVDNPPELKSAKQKHNRMVMKTMQKMFATGGKCIWVAPSGGRDRPNPENGKYQVAPFDSKSVEMFRLMAAKADKVTHFYPLSMFTYRICPPPQAVGGEIGETRTVKYYPAALHFGDEVDLSAFAEGCVADNFPEGCDASASRDTLREALSAHIHGIVFDNYQALASRIEKD
mmetsp:Transcript_4816/g.15237  ORF Transcript_4816/g.15237 Transcript_4816/m.15237 type:complete len:415 (+) Transcript_4816:33-1277(+)